MGDLWAGPDGQDSVQRGRSVENDRATEIDGLRESYASSDCMVQEERVLFVLI